MGHARPSSSPPRARAFPRPRTMPYLYPGAYSAAAYSPYYYGAYSYAPYYSAAYYPSSYYYGAYASPYYYGGYRSYLGGYYY